jgi:hypothetical protein
LVVLRHERSDDDDDDNDASTSGIQKGTKGFVGTFDEDEVDELLEEEGDERHRGLGLKDSNSSKEGSSKPKPTTSTPTKGASATDEWRAKQFNELSDDEDDDEDTKRKKREATTRQMVQKYDDVTNTSQLQLSVCRWFSSHFLFFALFCELT